MQEQSWGQGEGKVGGMKEGTEGRREKSQRKLCTAFREEKEL